MEAFKNWLLGLLTLASALLLTSCGGSDPFALNDTHRVSRAAAVVPYVANPQNGWWWDPNESGSGYALEVQGNQIFLAAFMYETSGASTWYAANLTLQADNSFVGVLSRYQGGQTLLGAYQPPTSTNVANATLAFTSATMGSLLIEPMAGGASRTVNLLRFPISTPTPFAAPSSGFESGWWWNTNQSGRGFFIEVQGSQAFMGAFMYDSAGQPTWYASWDPVNNGTVVGGPLQQYTNGQTLTGTWRAPTQSTSTVGTLTFNLTSPTTGSMTLPDGSTVQLSRFVFNPNAHFSDWSKVEGLALRPPLATVKVGNSQALNVAYCWAPPAGSPNAAVGYDCGTGLLPPGLTVTNCSVNGVAGGNSVLGQVSYDGMSTVTYMAPSTIPSPATVAVSCDATTSGSQAKTTLTSNITVVSATAGGTTGGGSTVAIKAYSGTFSGNVDQTIVRSSVATATLSGFVVDANNSVAGDVTRYINGSGKARVTTTPLNCDSVVQDVSFSASLLVWDPKSPSAGGAMASRYALQVVQTDFPLTTTSCGGVPVTTGASVIALAMDCANSFPTTQGISLGSTQPYSDPTRLNGSVDLTCAESTGGGQSADILYHFQWDLQGQ